LERFNNAPRKVFTVPIEEMQRREPEGQRFRDKKTLAKKP
jgi:hypothetical protein